MLAWLARSLILLTLFWPVPNAPPDPTSGSGILPGYNTTSSRTVVRVADISKLKLCVIASFGQSNGMANYNNSGSPYTILNPTKIYNLNVYDGKIYQTGSPLLGAGGTLDNWGNQFADKLIAGNYCNNVILVPCSISSTFVADWAVGGYMNPRIQIAQQWININGLIASGVIYQQGESDENAGTSGTSYANSLASVISTIQSNFSGVPIFISQTSYYLGATSTAITNAQAAATNGTTIFNMGNSDLLGSSNRYDGIHFNLTGSGLWTTTVSGNVGPNLIIH